MQPQIKILPNGLKTVFVDTKSFPSFTALLLVAAGSRYENEKNNGVAHFFEHMAFKGSKKYPSSMIIASTIEGIGGVFNAFTSKDHTGYWIKAPIKHFDTVVDVLADMVQTPLLVEDEIEREKGVISEEINLYEDTPYRKVGDIFEGLLYPGHPLGFDIAGTKESVNSFTRQTFVDYIDNLYHPKNSIFIVAGGLDKNGYFKILEDKFNKWTNGKKISFSPIVEKQEKPGLLVKYKKTEQAHFILGFRSLSLHNEKKTALGVLAAVLGGGMSSRLFYEVRERRGLCYYISTGREAYQDTGIFYTQAGVSIHKDKVKNAVETVLKEHKKITDGYITDDEIKKAKELIKGRFILSLEDSYNFASLYGRMLLLEDKIEEPEALIKKVDAVTKKELIALAQETFTEKKLNLAIIGPFEDKKIFEDVLTV